MVRQFPIVEREVCVGKMYLPDFKRNSRMRISPVGFCAMERFRERGTEIESEAGQSVGANRVWWIFYEVLPALIPAV